MLKILAAAVALAMLSAGPALAQGCGQSNPGCIVPTAPPGTSDNRAASTAFVGQQGATYINVMGYCTAAQVASDITTCAQNAIDAAAAAATTSFGGKVVFFPAQFSPYNLRGTLMLPGFVGLRGEGIQTTFINCANGAADCVQIGQSSGSQTRNQSITDLSIFGNGAKTGGAAVHITNSFRVLLQNVSFESACRGVDVDTNNNAITIQNATIIPNQTCSDYGIYWHDATTGATRSDVLTLDNVVMDGTTSGSSWSNATGLEWDGFANTLVASHLRILHMAKGICTNCVATATKANSPSFANLFDLEMEGFTSIALDLSHGFFSEFKAGESDINNLTGSVATSDTNAIAIGSGVTGFQLANSRVGDARQASISVGGNNVQLSNLQFFGTSVAGTGLFPVIDVLGTATGTQIHNIACGEQGGGANLASYCVQLESGSTDGLISHIDALHVVTGAINDLGSTRTSYRTFRSPTNFTGTAQGQWRDVLQAEMRENITNGATGANVKSTLQLTTGTANSYSLFSLQDNAGSPTLLQSVGSGVANGFLYAGPQFVWESVGGSPWFQVSNAHITGRGPAPTVSSCGDGTPAINGNDIHATVTLGTGTFTSCTITWNTARMNTPDCTVTSPSGATLTSYTPSGGSLILINSSNLTASAKFTYHCDGV